MKKIVSLILAVLMMSSVFVSGFFAQATVNLSTSSHGVEMIKGFEGCRLTAYKALQSETYYTIGYGHYGSDVYAGMQITQKQAEDLLISDLKKYEGYVNTFLNKYTISVNQNQFDSLVSFTYNLGNVWVQSTDFTLRTYLKNGVWKYTDEQITTAFTNWCKANGEVVQGLLNRRKAEAANFLSGGYAGSSALGQSMTQNFYSTYTLTGNGPDDILAVAQAQLDRSQSSMGYTEAWCADFVSDCAILAGQSSAIPADCNVTNLFNKIKNAGGYQVSSRQKGDVVFYYCSKCGVYTHVGLVLDSSYSIEGNYSSKVAKVGSRYSDGKYTNNVAHSTDNYISRVYLRPAYTSSSVLPSAPTLLNPSISNSFHAYDLYTGISYTPVNATNDIVVRWENTASYYMCAVKALDGEPNPGNSETGTMLVNYQKFTGNTITLYANGIADHLGKWIKVAIDPYNSSGGKGASAYYYFKCYSNNNTTEPPEAPTLNNPSISWYNNGSFKYGISYEDVDIESNLTLRWQNTADKYKIKVISLEGNPNPSASETVSSVMVAQTVVTSTSKTISKSVLKENAGKWVKVYIHAANTAANSDDVYGDAVYYYFKLADAAQQPEEPVSLSVSQSYVETTLTVNGNQAANIPLDLTLSGTNSTPTVTVSNPSIASCSYISKNGSVLKYSISPLKAGETDITFTVNVNGTKYTAVCHVVVTSEGGTDTPTTPTKTLEGIGISSYPNKTVYNIGESLDTAGLRITLYYSNGTTETISSGFTTSGFNSATAGTKNVTVTYQGKTASFNVQVIDNGPAVDNYYLILNATSVNIQLTSADRPVQQTLGYQTNIPSTITWTVENNNGAVAISQNSNGTVNIIALKEGSAVLKATANYNNKRYSAECVITVSLNQTPPVADKTIYDIKIASLPNVTEYTYKSTDTPNLTGLTLKVFYSDGTSEIVTDTSKMNVSNFSTKKPVGTKTITVEYEGFETEFNITVKYTWWQWLLVILTFGRY